MPQILPNNRLNRLVRATKEQINYWQEGVSLQNDSGETIA